jgi:hypothetical protein
MLVFFKFFTELRIFIYIVIFYNTIDIHYSLKKLKHYTKITYTHNSSTNNTVIIPFILTIGRTQIFML